MEKVVVQSRVPPSLKEEADKILAEMGLTISEAIRLTMYQIVSDYSLPFTPKLRKPSPQFKEAIRELDEGKGKHCNSLEELKQSWEEEDK